MKYPEILELIKALSKSQGFYGRLLRSIEAMDEEQHADMVEQLEAKNFKDGVSFVMWLES